MCQGFMVHVTANTTINATESCKIVGNPTFLKTNSNNAATQLMRLSLFGAPSFNDETVLYLNAMATDNFDASYDAVKLAGQDPYAPTIALEKGSDLFQINGVAPIVGTFTMGLKTLTGYSGTYTISLQDYNSFPQNACINLFDKFTNITTNLKLNNYIFNLADTTTVARFNLIITLNPLNIASNVSGLNCVSQNNGSITAIGLSSGPWDYTWKNTTGNIIKQSLNKFNGDTVSNLIAGQYELEISTVGSCDNNTTTFSISPIQLPIAQFGVIDSVDVNSSITFSNNSTNAAYFNWNFGDNIGTSAFYSPTYSYSNPGIYNIKLISTSIDGCQDSITKLIKVNSVVGINHNAINNLFLLKKLNNNHYELICQSNTISVYKAILYDGTGKKLKDFGDLNNSFHLSIPLSNYNSGIYYLSLTDNTFNKTLKLIKD
ncbi:MAG: PKD domain-containing protein [Bacteroidota bacterium]|nr:PKD domain-containing protein [Bacteroidota bacterium]